jgi:hypothetical protein
MTGVAQRARPALLAALILLLIGATGAAQTGDGYDLTWNTIDGGGGTSTADVFVVDGTAGQPDAATVGGGAFLLSGGFWAGITSAAAGCVGDCGHNGTVTVDEIITLMSIALGTLPSTTCETGSGAHPGRITVDQILAAVNNALNRCP